MSFRYSVRKGSTADQRYLFGSRTGLAESTIDGEHCDMNPTISVFDRVGFGARESAAFLFFKAGMMDGGVKRSIHCFSMLQCVP
jgi:hypothetical protein